MAILNSAGKKTPTFVEGNSLCGEFDFTLPIFQGVSLPTLSNLVQWTPLVVEVHFLVLLHLKGVSSVFFETVP